MHKKPAQALCFNVTDTEGSVLLSCADTIALTLVLASDKLDKKLLSGAKIVISKDWALVFTINAKAQGSSTEQPVNSHKPQPRKCSYQSRSNELVYILFHWIGKFKGKPYQVK